MVNILIHLMKILKNLDEDEEEKLLQFYEGTCFNISTKSSLGVHVKK